MNDTHTRTVFPYPGGKTRLADWICTHLPNHRCYVEPFGGAASVLFHKPPSTVEVLNDRDGDVTQFFSVLRDRPDELIEWLEAVPYARDLHHDWVTAFYAGDRSEDPIERAGRFFFLRYSQALGKYDSDCGFRASCVRDAPANFKKSVTDLRAFADRLRSVIIENKGYVDLVDHYDTPDTVFYFDPPYHGSEDMYPASEGFSHDELYRTLDSIDGRWIASYLDIPPQLAEYRVVSRADHTPMGMMHTGNTGMPTDEKLIMNFDPDSVPQFSGPTQTTLSEVSD